MSTKKLVKKLFLFEGRRNIGLTVIGVVTLFLCLPVHFVQLLQEFQSEYDVPFKQASESLWSEKNEIIYNLFYVNMEFSVMLVILAAMNGIILFSYLHSKEKLDFYLGQPIRRGTLFWCGFWQGIGCWTFSYIINLLFIVVLALINGCCSGTFLQIMLYSCLNNTIIYCGIYAFASLITILTGKMIFSILGIISLSMYLPAYTIFFDFLNYDLLERFGWIRKILLYFSPVTIFGQLYSKIEFAVGNSTSRNLMLYQYDWKYLMILGVFATVSLILARIFYEMRKPEAVGEAIVFPRLRCIIKALFLLYIVILFSWYLPNAILAPRMIFYVIGFLAGILIGLFLLDVILEQNWGAFLHNWKREYGYIMFCVLFVFIVTGYDYAIKYHGFHDIPSENLTKEELVEKGYVVEFDSGMLMGMENWDEFVQNSEAGKNGKIRIVNEWENFRDYTDIIYNDGTYTIYKDNDIYEKEVYQYVTTVQVHFDRTDEDCLQTILCNKKDFSSEDYGKEYSYCLFSEPIED